MKLLKYNMFAFPLMAVLLMLLLFSCRQPVTVETVEQQIARLENELFDQDGVIIAENADALISLYEQWADSLPQHPRSPEYLFIASDLSINSINVNRTMRLLDKVISGYSDYANRGLCMFLKGFVYEEQLNDTASARVQYEAFLKEYPEHEFADDAHLAIRNLGKSVEDLIREFESANEQ